MRLNLKDQKLSGRFVRIICCGDRHNLDAMNLEANDIYRCTTCNRPLIIRGRDGKVYLINDKPMF